MQQQNTLGSAGMPYSSAKGSAESS